MEAIFTRQEIDFWCNYLGNNPGLILSEVSKYKESGELITINEVRRVFGFPDRTDGNILLDGSVPDLTPPSKELAVYAKMVMQSRDANLTDEVFAAKFPKIQELINGG